MDGMGFACWYEFYWGKVLPCIHVVRSPMWTKAVGGGGWIVEKDMFSIVKKWYCKKHIPKNWWLENEIAFEAFGGWGIQVLPWTIYSSS